MSYAFLGCHCAIMLNQCALHWPLFSGSEAPIKYEKRTCGGPAGRGSWRMTTYSQFCPVAKAAEVFGDRWTPIIVRELCFGTRSFGELLDATPLISRTVLAQRLKQLHQSGVVHIEAKARGK